VPPLSSQRTLAGSKYSENFLILGLEAETIGLWKSLQPYAWNRRKSSVTPGTISLAPLLHETASWTVPGKDFFDLGQILATQKATGKALLAL